MSKAEQYVDEVDAQLEAMAADPDVTDDDYKVALDDITDRCAMAKEHTR